LSRNLQSLLFIIIRNPRFDPSHAETGDPYFVHHELHSLEEATEIA
jgi:hypothetical protein